MKVTAELNNLRISPRKVKLVADLLKGLDVSEAVNQADITIKKTSEYLHKLLLSAIANAENNFGLSKNNLYVFDVIVGAGPTLKRWMPKAYGRAGKILKRTSKVRIILEERVEGKDRKSKEQLEKEKLERIKQAKEDLKKEEIKNKETEKDNIKEGKITDTKVKNEEKSKKGVSEKKGWKNKIFHRKSM